MFQAERSGFRGIGNNKDGKVMERAAAKNNGSGIGKEEICRAKSKRFLFC